MQIDHILDNYFTTSTRTNLLGVLGKLDILQHTMCENKYVRYQNKVFGGGGGGEGVDDQHA